MFTILLRRGLLHCSAVHGAASLWDVVRDCYAALCCKSLWTLNVARPCYVLVYSNALRYMMLLPPMVWRATVQQRTLQCCNCYCQHCCSVFVTSVASKKYRLTRSPQSSVCISARACLCVCVVLASRHHFARVAMSCAVAGNVVRQHPVLFRTIVLIRAFT